jgi:hypothetical protein
MGLFSGYEEPADCWQLVGPDDVATPPSVAIVLNCVGTRTEWRRAGFPVLFDVAGRPRSVLRAGREYAFVRVTEEVAARLPHCAPRVESPPAPSAPPASRA